MSPIWCHALRFLVSMCLCLGAQAQTAPDFDHLKTGFALSGSHTNTRCESCHIGGVFKGTPRDCESCHVAGSRFAKANVVKTANHIPSLQSCDTCHNVRSFSGARMNHSGLPKGTCASCHNGSQAVGKSNNHLRTTASCDTCHVSSAWRPVTAFDHTGVAPGTCATCHDGRQATGKSPSHTPYAQVASMASANCDTCHKAGFKSWTPARLHSSVTVTAQCATCHAAIKPATTVHVGQTVCETCHKSTTVWTGAKIDHSSFNVATNCTTCHNGSGATGKSGTHVPVGNTNCIACHNTNLWKPSSFNHTQVPVTAQCASCHTGTFPPADGKSTSHTPYQLVAASASANCDTCHKAGYVSWTPAKLHLNVTMTAQCASCHAAIKPATTVHTGQTVCETCHKSTTVWTGAKIDHSTFTVATNCITCHNGSGATGKSGTHVPVGVTNCIACHSTKLWKPSSFNHTQVPVTAQCASCHTGTFPPADGKSTSHTPYQLVAASASANCDTCHKAGYVSWTPAKLHLNVTMTVQCASCHAAIKPATTVHTGQTVCETCHKSTTVWTGAKIDHSTFTVATNCTSCHNGGTATGKSGTHIPVGVTNCIACHTTAAWKPSRFNHTQVPVTAQCASCHSGAFPPADGKNAGHVPYQLVAGASTANCDTCHKSSFTTWANGKVHINVSIAGQCKTCHVATYASQGATPKPANHIPEAQLLNGAAMECNACHKTTTTWSETMNHNSSLGGGAGWCKSCHQSGTTYLGTMQRMPLTHQKKTPPAIDCSESGCHRPLGTKGTVYRSWD